MLEGGEKLLQEITEQRIMFNLIHGRYKIKIPYEE